MRILYRLLSIRINQWKIKTPKLTVKFLNWSRAWKENDLEGFLALYAEDVVLESPLFPYLLGVERGIIKGKEALTKNRPCEITVVHQLTTAQKQDLHVLYKNEWWSANRSLEDIEIIIQKSSLIIGLVDPPNNHLIGFTRVLSDYFKYAYIYDVIIHPEYRRLDLGKKLLDLVLQHPEIRNLSCIELTCKKNMKSFYKQFGFTEDYGESIAMRRHKD